jgi:two-component system, OmpR family, response regulator
MRLLLVEDDHALARSVAEALAQGACTVAVAPNAAQALRLAVAERFNVAILDLGLPDRDGLDLLRELRRAGQSLPILILSARDGLDDRISGLDMGADDYLVKPFALGELEARLRALLRRHDNHAQVCKVGAVGFDLEAKQASVSDQPLELTAREVAILEVLILQVHRIVSKHALFDVVFPSNSDAGPNALEVHISRLRYKLKGAGVTIRSVRGLGYRLEESADGPSFTSHHKKSPKFRSNITH